MVFSSSGSLDSLDLFQFLDAALHLLGLGRLVAEAVDEHFQLLDALALVAVGGFQLLLALRFLRQIFLVVAGIEMNSFVPDLDDLVDGDVEESSGRAKSERKRRDNASDTLPASCGLRGRGGWWARRAAAGWAVAAAAWPARCASASRRRILRSAGASRSF